MDVMDSKTVDEQYGPFKIVEENGEVYAVGKGVVLYNGILWDKRQFSLKGIHGLTQAY